MKYALVAALLGAMAIPALAQDSGEAPDHGVARVSFLDGEVNVQRGDSGELVAAELNTPLVAQDHVLTDQSSRAEIQLDWANLIRLAPESEIRMAELKDRDFLVQVAAGTVTFRVLRDSNSQVEISTPTVAIRPRMAGSYRITVNDDFSTEVTVRSGEAEIFAGNKTDSVRAGQTLLVSGDPSDPQRVYRSAIAKDEWDRWNESRDHDLERSDSYKYISRDIYGAEDLYGYGRWVYDPAYGWVWAPAVDAAWAPYRVGRWTWVDYYGWTWVSGDPWGWAPYHYGRWYHAPSYGWVWYPGETRVRYYWRPALVSFFGWGVNVGWVSLAPHEIYRPWYGPGRTIVNNVTIVHNVNVIDTYRNARFISGRSGVTSVVAGDFGRRRVAVNSFVAASDRDLSRAGDAGRWLQHEPSRENRQFSDRQVSPRSVRHREPDHGFVSTRPDWNDVDHRDRNGSRVTRGSGNGSSDARLSPRNDGGAPQPGLRQAEGNRGREENSGRGMTAGQPPQAAARNDGPRNDERRPTSFGDDNRRRQGDTNRGREENPARGATAGPAQTAGRSEGQHRGETATFPTGDQDRSRQADPNRGRGQNAGAAAIPPTQNAGSNNGTGRGAGVGFPRGDQDRAHQADSNRGGNDAAAGNVVTGAGNTRRTEPPARNQAVTFPREADRSRQADPNRRTAANNNADPGLSSRNSGSPDVAPRNSNAAAFPRTEPDRDHRSGNNSGNQDGFNRRNNNEAARPGNPAPEPIRRQEPVARTTSPDSNSSRNAAPRNRPEEVQRSRGPENSPARAPERERPSESASNSRAESPRSAASPEASSGSSSGGQGRSSDHSRGRDRH